MFRKKIIYMDWDVYKKKITALEIHGWQQKVRKQGLA